MSKKRRQPKTKKYSRQASKLNKFSVGFYSGRHLGEELAIFIKEQDERSLEENLKHFFKRENVREVLNSNSFRLENFAQRPVFPNVGLKKTLATYRSFFLSNSDEIKSHLSLKIEFESNFHYENKSRCIEILEKYRNNIGESIWYLKSKLLALYYWSDSEEMQNFCTEITERSTTTLMQSLVKLLILTTQSNSPLSNLQSVIQRTIRDLRKSDQKEIADLIQHIFVPGIVEIPDLDVESLFFFQLFNSVDQYDLTKSFLTEAIARKNVTQNQNEDIKKHFHKLEKFFEDKSLKALDRLSKPGLIVDDHGLSILKAYEEGDYDSVLQSFFSRKISGHSVPAYLNVIAKSLIYRGLRIDNASSELEKTINNLIEIHSLSSKTARAYEDLITASVRLYGTPLSSFIQLALCTASPYLLSEADLVYQTTRSIMSDENVLPLTLSMNHAKYRIFSENYQFISKYRINTHRSKRTNLETENLSTWENDCLKKDVIEHKVRCHILSGNQNGLIEEAAKALVENENSFICFPFDHLIQHIAENLIATQSSVIVCYYYNKYISKDSSTLLNETFEEYLFLESAEKPSDLMEKFSDRNLTDQESLFFRDICSLENMDFLATFQSSDELRLERLEIIQKLLDHGIITKKEHSSETETILNQVVLDSAASNFERSRIYVDENTIRRKKSSELKTLFEMYKYSGKTIDDERILVLNENSESFRETLVSGGKSEILLKFIDVIIESFLYDENHGLDSNLSTEIRHGFFSNFLRSEVEKNHLITEIDEAGNYKDNQHWLEIYQHLIRPETMQQLDEFLREFSETFNDIIERSQRWIKVTQNQPSSDAIFDYSIALKDYEDLKVIAESAKNYTELTDRVFEILWKLTDQALLEIRDKVNVDLKRDFDRAFDELEFKIKSKISPTAFSELINSISEAKNNTQKIIEEISEWFNISVDKEFSSQTLSQLIDVASKCMEKLKGYPLSINKNLSATSGKYKFESKHVKPLILSLANIFENCLKHSGHENETKIKIVSNLNESALFFDIKNHLSISRIEELDVHEVQEIDRNLHSPRSIELMRAEGGSGLAKSFHYLKSIDQNFDINVNLQEDHFVTRVTHVH